MSDITPEFQTCLRQCRKARTFAENDSGIKSSATDILRSTNNTRKHQDEFMKEAYRVVSFPFFFFLSFFFKILNLI